MGVERAAGASEQGSLRTWEIIVGVLSRRVMLSCNFIFYLFGVPGLSCGTQDL